MNLEQLMGRYLRLRQELAQVYGHHPWHTSRIDRLTADIADVERELAARAVSDGPWPACAVVARRA